ncbi:MAG: DUF3488 and transglutaminase-like domain-containing protein [Ketobacteraceae bacterium]|nr:DUF3488 and transglutaminase-like domain-containing protein [Ketobacteraceae bacterium]
MSQAIYPIPRNSLIWLLVAVSLAILPHLSRLPAWMWLVVVGSLLWRIQVFRQRWRFPNKWLRMALVFGGTAGIFFSYGTLLGPEAGVGLLSLAYSFKLLEMYRERDAYLIVILSYFVLATNYLFERGLFDTLFSLLVTAVVTAALVGLNQTRFNSDFKRTFRLAGKMMLHSVPLMLILFVLVPRIGPLWSMNLDSNKSKTGISDRVTPGDISELNKSSELAFRVEFVAGDIPQKRHLYWRGPVFSHFDGRTWSVNKGVYEPRKSVWGGIEIAEEDIARRLIYRMFLEPTNQEWIFAIPFAEINHEELYLTQDLTWARENPVTHNFSYEVTTYLNYRRDAQQLSWTEKQQNLQLPPSGDTRARAWAIEHFARLGSDPELFIDFLFQHFNSEPFSYTLRPTPLYVNTIDQFLFTTRNGFCTHYAGAFVFLLRSVGIPARMIGGYQGGEVHESGTYLTVRQYAAHAWAEVWIRGRGWVRFDPTMAVAPERILDGAEGLSDDENFLSDSPLSPNRVRNWPGMSELRRRLEHLDYLWTKWVVGYNTVSQTEFLSRFLGNVTPQKIAYTLAIIGGGCVLLFAVLLLWDRPRHRLNPVDKQYLKFCRKLQKKGFERRPGEGPYGFAKRVSLAMPQQAARIARITALYVRLRYAPQHNETEINGKRPPYRGRLAPGYYELKQEINLLRL